MPDRAGFVPLRGSVKTMDKVAPSALVAGPKHFPAVGTVEVTGRHWSVEVLATIAVVTLAARLVRAAAGQVPTSVGSLVRPESVTVHETVPEVTAMPVRPESTRVATV